MEAARAAFAEGQFTKASELSAALNTSEGYAFAAESLAIHGYHIAKGDRKKAPLERATKLAKEAIRLDPENPNAHLQLAHALGRYTQTVGLTEAFRRNYPEKAREALEEALRLNPDMAAAHFSLGSWHAEAWHAGGVMAGILYGASEKDALDHFQRALDLMPNDKPTLYLYAYGILLLDRRSNYDRASELLARAIKIPPKDAYTRIIHELATALLGKLKANPPRATRHPAQLGQP